MSSLAAVTSLGKRALRILMISRVSSTLRVVWVSTATFSGSGISTVSASATLATMRIRSGASPLVPTISSCFSCPTRMIQYPWAAKRRTSRWTFSTSGQVASMRICKFFCFAAAHTAGEMPWALKIKRAPAGTSSRVCTKRTPRREKSRSTRAQKPRGAASTTFSTVIDKSVEESARGVKRMGSWRSAWASEQRGDFLRGDGCAVQRYPGPALLVVRQAPKARCQAARKEIGLLDEFRLGQLTQRLDQARILGKFAAVGVEHRRAMGERVGDDAIAGFGHDHVGGAHQIVIAKLGAGQDQQIAVAPVRLAVGRDEKKLVQPLELFPGQALQAETAEAQENARERGRQ